jgi:hypothetical protein
MWALISTFGVHFILAGILKLIQDTLTFAGPVFLNMIVTFVGTPSSDPDSKPLWYGLVIVVSLMLSSIIQSLALQTYFHNVFRISMHVCFSYQTTMFCIASETLISNCLTLAPSCYCLDGLFQGFPFVAQGATG